MAVDPGFDATLMLITMAIYNVLHPSRIIYKERQYGGVSSLESQESGYAMDDRRTVAKR